MTTDTMSRAYSESPATSIDSRGTVFVIGTRGHLRRNLAAIEVGPVDVVVNERAGIHAGLGM
jgi:hypothetical protein